MAAPTINNLQTVSFTNETDLAFVLPSYTPTSGENGKLVIRVRITDNTRDWRFSGVTYAGFEMTKVNEEIIEDSVNRDRVGIWERNDPLGVAASGDILVTTDRLHNYDRAVIFAVTLLGAAQNSPTAGEKATGTSTTSPLGISVTPDDDDSQVLSIVSTDSDSAAPTPTSPHTQEGLEINRTAIGHTEVATATASTVEWTFSAGSRYALAAASFGPVVNINVTVSPGVGVVLLAGVAPTPNTDVITADSPGVGTVSLVTTAPTTVTRLNNRKSPGAGTVLLAGAAPATPTAVVVASSPGVGVLLFTGMEPFIPNTGIETKNPGAGTVLVVGSSPTVKSFVSTRKSPGAGKILILGVNPLAQQPIARTIFPGPGSIKLFSSAPVLQGKLDDWASLPSPSPSSTWTRIV